MDLRTALLLTLLGAGATSLPAQWRLEGVVRDRATLEALPGANVRTESGVAGTAAGADGRFVLVVPSPADSLVMVSHVGYTTVRRLNVMTYMMTNTLLVIDLAESPILMGETVVTAGRREQSLLEVPVSIAAISAADITGRVAVTLEEPLRFVSGVNVMDDQINIRGSSGYSRGVGSRVLLLLDGMPLLTGDTGEIIWEAIPPQQIDRVEVVKGAGSALYGSSALGGVINVIPSRIPAGTSVGARATVGVYDRPPHDGWVWSSRPRLTSTTGVSYMHGTGEWGTALSATRWMDEGHRKNDVVHRYAFLGRVESSVGDDDVVHATAHYVHRRSGNFFWWKSLADPLEPPDEYANRWVTSDRGFLAAMYRSVLSTSSFVTVRGLYFGNRWTDEDAGVLTTEARSDRFFAEGQYTSSMSKDLHLVTGTAAFLDRVRSNIFGTHPGIGWAAFVQADYSGIERMSLTAGLRFDVQRVDALPSDRNVDPRIGATYRLTPGTAVRASVGTGFRYPSIGELYTSISTGFGGINVVPNTRLRAERSISGEVGVQHRIGEMLAVDAAVFQSDYDDLIEAGVDTDELVVRFENVERARVRGFECTVALRSFIEGVSATAGYTYIDPRNRTTGSVLRFRPRHTAVASLAGEYRPVSATVEYRFVSRLEAVDENLINLGNIANGGERVDIHVMNVRAASGFEVAGLPLRMGLEVRNILNYQYVELLANMAPSRTVLLSLEAGFR